MEKIEDAYDKSSQGKLPPSLSECSRLLKVTAAGFGDIFIVIDALDECTETTREAMFDHIRKAIPCARLLITSRYGFGTQFEVNHSYHIVIQANT